MLNRFFALLLTGASGLWLWIPGRRPGMTESSQNARRSANQQHFAPAKQDGRQQKREHEIDYAEDQQRRQQSLLLKLREREQHRCFDYAQTPRRMAQES